MQIGYVRAGNNEACLTEQSEVLRQAGCEKIFSDRCSVPDRKKPGLDKAVAFAREGDVLVVCGLDRLGKNSRALVEFLTWVNSNGIHFRALNEAIDTRQDNDYSFLNSVDALAKMESKLGQERAAHGVNKNPRGGRKSLMTAQKKQAAAIMIENNAKMADVAEAIGVSIQTLYRHFPAGGHNDTTGHKP